MPHKHFMLLLALLLAEAAGAQAQAPAPAPAEAAGGPEQWRTLTAVVAPVSLLWFIGCAGSLVPVLGCRPAVCGSIALLLGQQAAAVGRAGAAVAGRPCSAGRPPSGGMEAVRMLCLSCCALLLALNATHTPHDAAACV